MAEARAKAEWKKLAAVVGFAGRVSGISKERDAKTEAAVAAALPPRPPSAKHLNPAQRLQQEERLEKMEDAGVYENRLGLKEKQRAAILSPAHALPHGASPHGPGPISPSSHLSPVPAHRTLGSRQQAGTPYDRSPVSSERRLSDDDDTFDTAQAASAPLSAPLGRAHSFTEGIAAFPPSRGSFREGKPGPLSVRPGLAAPTPASPLDKSKAARVLSNITLAGKSPGRGGSPVPPPIATFRLDDAPPRTALGRSASESIAQDAGGVPSPKPRSHTPPYESKAGDAGKVVLSSLFK